MSKRMINVGAVAGGDAYLFMGSEKVALIDSGFGFCAPNMIKNIQEILGDRPLDYVLLSHSHYDHALGSCYCHLIWPNVQVKSTVYAAKILRKSSAQAVMLDLDRSAAAAYGYQEGDLPMEYLYADGTMEDGDTISLGDRTLVMVASPGHTRCSAAFWCPEEQLLFSSETMGCYAEKNLVMPSALVGYQMAMDFIERAENLHPQKILVPHYGILEGEQCQQYMENAKRCYKEVKEQVCQAITNGSHLSDIAAWLKAHYYTAMVREVQPETAFDMNARHMVIMFAKEFSLPLADE